MKKCNFLNPDRYEFLIWFFLGVMLTTVFWLIVVVVPQFKEYEKIIKEIYIVLIIISMVSIFIILIYCKISLLKKKVQTKEIITLLKIFASILLVSLFSTIIWRISYPDKNVYNLIGANTSAKFTL